MRRSGSRSWLVVVLTAVLVAASACSSSGGGGALGSGVGGSGAGALGSGPVTSGAGTPGAPGSEATTSGAERAGIELTPTTPATAPQLAQVADLARSRLDALGVDGVRAQRTGTSVQVTFASALPPATIAELQQVLAATGTFALRPVLQAATPAPTTGSSTSSGSSGSTAGGSSILAGIESPAPNPCAQPAGSAGRANGDEAALPDPTRTTCLLVGSPATGGSRLASAHAAQQHGTWWLQVKYASAAVAEVDRVLDACYERAASCPTAQAAMVLDGVVLAAPLVQGQDLAANPYGIQIGGGAGTFSEGDAKALAAVLGSGPLPVEVRATTTPG